jgi:hypothetical protein
MVPLIGPEDTIARLHAAVGTVTLVCCRMYVNPSFEE